MSDSEQGDITRMLRDSAAGFVDGFDFSAHVRKWRGKAEGFDRARWREMAGLGWLGLRCEEAFGGSGLGLGEACALLGETGRGLGPEPLAAVAILAARVISLSDNAALKSRLLPGLCDGSNVVAVAWQEQAGAMDSQSIQTRATLRDGAYVLSGAKDFVHAAPAADSFVIAAQTDEGIALFYAPKDAPGLAIEPRYFTDGGVYGRLTFTDLRVTPSEILASAAFGAIALDMGLDEMRIALSAEILGVTSAALAMTLDYLRQRTQFGKPIGSFQALQHRAVDLYVSVELTRAAVDRAVRAFEEDQRPTARAIAASACKARASDTAQLIAKEAIQMHGAIGYTDEHDIGLFVRRALVLAAWLGNGMRNRKRFAALSPVSTMI